MRYLSLWLNHFPTDCWRRANGLSEQPLILVATVNNHRLLKACDERAHALGLYPGLALADALARYPSLHVLDADPARDKAALRHLALWCLRFSPIVAMEGEDGILLDITGCDAYWKSEANLLQLLLTGVRRFYSCHGAIAGTIGASWGQARFGKPDQAIWPQTGLRDHLKELPIEALRIEAAMADQLRRLGFGRIGDLYPIKRAALAARFGRALTDRLQQALGEEAEGLHSILPPPSFRVAFAFPEPVSTAEDLHRTARLLLPRLCAAMEARAQGALRLAFSCYRVDGKVSEVTIGLAAPSASADHLYHLLRGHLEKIEPGFGIEEIILSARRSEALRREQRDWQHGHRGSDLAEMIDRLANRLGEKNIYRFAPVESHVPERAVKKMPPLQSMPSVFWAQHPTERPLRLLTHPEPIKALAPVPDDLPLQFEWRRRWHRVKKASGPERIEAEWWRRITDPNRQERLRDYYRVRDEAGHEFWLYREGHYQAAHPPRWFLHGFFC